MTVVRLASSERPRRLMGLRNRRFRGLVAAILTIALLAGVTVYRFGTHQGGPLSPANDPYTGTIFSTAMVHQGEVESYYLPLTNNSDGPITITGASPIGMGSGLSVVGVVVSRIPMKWGSPAWKPFPPGANQLFRLAVGDIVPAKTGLSTAPRIALGIRMDRPGDWTLHGLRVTYLAGGFHYAANLGGSVGGTVFCVDQPTCSVPKS